MRGSRGLNTAKIASHIFIVLSLLSVPVSWATDPIYEVDISATQATEAIKQLAAQTEHSVLFLAGDVESVRTSAIAGSFTVDDALTSLLQKTDLTYSLTESRVITVTRANTNSMTVGIRDMRNNKPSLIKRMGTLIAGALLAPVLSASEAAQTTAPEEEEFIEEIVVTATYRETAEMDTPVSMATVTGDLIEATSTLDFNDIMHLVSGLTFSGQNESEGVISIRGVSDGSVRGETYSVTSVYYDDTPVSGVTSPSRHGGGTAFDMERVEVLMGPQGVLGGAGNIAGLVRFVTKKPEMNTWRAKIQSNIQSINSGGDGYRLDAMLNIPVIEDKLAFRVLGVSLDNPGWIDRPEFNDLDRNSKDIQSGRITAKWLPTDKLQVRASWSHTKSDVGGDARASTSVPHTYLSNVECKAASPTSRCDFAPEPVGAETPPGSFDDTDQYNLTVEYELPFADFLSSTSKTEREGVAVFWDRLWSYVNYDNQVSADLNYAKSGDICWRILDGRNCTEPGFVNVADQHFNGIAQGHRIFFDADVQEFRLTSNYESRLNWVVGSFYKKERSVTETERQFSLFPEFSHLRDDYLTQTRAVNGDNRLNGNEEKAIYATADFALTDTLEVNLGVRWNDVKVYWDLNNRQVVNSFGSNQTGNSPVEDVTSRVGLTWRPRDGLMFYTVYSTGFRPGGVNSNMYTEVGVLDIIRAGDATPDVYTCEDFTPNLVLGSLSAGGQFRNCPIGLQESRDYDVVRAGLLNNVYFEGDTIENVEIGAKISLFNNRVNVIATIYEMDWKNIIVAGCLPDEIIITRPCSSGSRILVNAGHAFSDGATLDIAWTPIDNLYLKVGGSISDSMIDDNGPPNRRYARQHANATEAQIACECIPIPNSPAWTWNAAVAYTFPVGSYEGEARLDWYASAKSWSRAFYRNINLNENYDQGNARFTLRDPVDNQWRVSLFVKNLTNEDTILRKTSSEFSTWAQPRTLGLELIYEFL